MSERSAGSGVMRYWPVLAVAAVIAVVVAVVAVTGARSTDQAGRTASGVAADGQPPALAAFAGEDPMSAPDCDRTTGRIKVPTVYAPNCVPLWDPNRDNGGSTYAGVTKESITVVVYVPKVSASAQAINAERGVNQLPADEMSAQRQKIVRTYNDLWETYGRKVKVVDLTATGENNDDAAAKADAIRAATELGAFAVIGGPTGTNAFADELVARKVLCLCTASQPVESYERWAPYVWPAQMASTQAYVHRADFVRSLAGKPAEFGGDAVRTTTRKFGLVYSDNVDNAYLSGVQFFEKRLSDGGVSLATKLSYILDLTKAAEDARGIIARLKDQGVTSVIFAGDPYMPRFLTAEATTQGYFPEWIVTGSSGVDSSTSARGYDQRQWRHAFGITLLPARITQELTEQEGTIVSWHLGEKLSPDLALLAQLLEIGRFFTGVHLAGPTLNPETFRAAMFSFKPVTGVVTQVSASYGNHGYWPWTDYSGPDDAALVWWDPDAEGPSGSGQMGKGLYRYVNGGQRYLPGQLADAQYRMFDPAGTSLLYRERPVADRAPDYPNRASRQG